MRIKWYGTASLLIEGGGTRILVDPYLKKYNPKLPRVPIAEAAKADAAVITHPHLDHFRDVAAFTEAGLKKIYVSQNGIEHAKENAFPAECIGRMRPIGAGESFSIGDIAVRTFQSRHCRFDLVTILGVLFDPRTWLRLGNAVDLLRDCKRFKITDDIYALEFSCEGKKLLVLGSAGLDGDTVYETNADLLVFPYQGRSGMHRYMVPFVERLRPKAVMPDHFDDAFPPLTHTVSTKKFLSAMKKRFPEVKAFVPAEGEWYDI